MNGELWPLNRLGKNGKTRTKPQFHGPQMGTGEDVDRESSSLLQGTCLLNSKHFAKDPDVNGGPHEFCLLVNSIVRHILPYSSINHRIHLVVKSKYGL